MNLNPLKSHVFWMKKEQVIFCVHTTVPKPIRREVENILFNPVFNQIFEQILTRL